MEIFKKFFRFNTKTIFLFGSEQIVRIKIACVTKKIVNHLISDMCRRFN